MSLHGHSLHERGYPLSQMRKLRLNPQASHPQHRCAPSLKPVGSPPHPKPSESESGFSFLLLLLLFFNFFDFILERPHVIGGKAEREREGERESQAGSTPNAEPNAGLDPTNGEMTT